MEGRRTPHGGEAALTPEGRAIGVVTSGGFGPSVGRALAIAHLDRDARAPDADAAVGVRARRENLAGAVRPLPFYREGTARRPLRDFEG